jgi:diguanylate cyclase (GGDEF)-like protein/PAS domain S-box-containing protein
MRSSNSLWRLIGGISLVVLVAAWALALSHSHEVRQKTYAEAGQDMEAMAEAYAAHAQLSLAVADETLQRLQEVLQRDGETAFGRVARIVSREDPVGGNIDRVVLVGADGRTTGESYVKGEKVGSVDVSEREYFKAFRADPTDRIFVTEPIIGKKSGKWVILFVRPVLNNGRFAGVIFVGLETSSLASLVKTVENSGVLVTLLSPGRRIVARSLAPEGAIGKTIDTASPIPESRGVFSFTSPIDGLTRLSAAHDVPGWGMQVIAGIDRNKLENEITAHNRIAIIPALLLTILLIPAALLVRRAVRSQQAAERASRNEAARSRRVLESMAEGVLLIDLDGSIIFANDAAKGWLNDPIGHLFAAVLRASGLALVTEDGMPFAAPDPLEHLCLQSGLNLENAWLRDSTSQQTHWLALQAHPLFDEENRVNGALATIVDRSDEHERITEAEMSKTVLARMSDAVLITDAGSTIHMVNTAFCRLSGFSEQDVIGQNPAFLGSERHDEAFWSEVWQTLKRDGSWSGKVWNRHKSGSEYCVWHTITAVRDLSGRIARYVSVSRDITEQQALESELWHRANFDPLTGLDNRARFEDRLTQTFTHVARHEHAFAVCYLDLDRFKPVNDTLGHAAGDAVLRQVAQRMRAVVRKDDTLARIGGDEFALLIPRMKSIEGTTRVAEKIIGALSLPFMVDEGTAKIGVSVGIAIYPQHGTDAATLTANADRALYRAKAEGRNVWRFAETDVAEAQSNRI